MAQELSNQDWQNLLERRPTGQIYAVATTRILCRFGCPSRPPNRANVFLVTDRDREIAIGYRLCKRCWPEV